MLRIFWCSPNLHLETVCLSDNDLAHLLVSKTPWRPLLFLYIYLDWQPFLSSTREKWWVFFITATGFLSWRAQGPMYYHPWPQYQQKVLMKPKTEAGLKSGGSLASCTLYTITSWCNKGTYQMLLPHRPLLVQGGCLHQTQAGHPGDQGQHPLQGQIASSVPWATAKSIKVLKWIAGWDPAEQGSHCSVHLGFHHTGPGQQRKTHLLTTTSCPFPV